MNELPVKRLISKDAFPSSEDDDGHHCGEMDNLLHNMPMAAINSEHKLF